MSDVPVADECRRLVELICAEGREAVMKRRVFTKILTAAAMFGPFAGKVAKPKKPRIAVKWLPMDESEGMQTFVLDPAFEKASFSGPCSMNIGLMQSNGDVTVRINGRECSTRVAVVGNDRIITVTGWA